MGFFSSIGSGFKSIGHVITHPVSSVEHLVTHPASSILSIGSFMSPIHAPHVPAISVSEPSVAATPVAPQQQTAAPMMSGSTESLLLVAGVGLVALLLVRRRR
jgi:hypothetical protein